MSEHTSQDRPVELLKQLGLKEYEAKSFVTLSRLPEATAKDIAAESEVPRTRVYDAIRVLGSEGLVEIQHSSPQVFRAVPIETATEILEREYVERIDALRETMADLEPIESGGEQEPTHEVWSLTGARTIATRTRDLVDDAESEVVLVLGNSSVYTEDLRRALSDAAARGADLVIGTTDDTLREAVERRFPDARVFVSGLDRLDSPPLDGDETVITRLLLVDRATILVSTRTDPGEVDDERAIFGDGFDNGLVAIARRLMATGLVEGGASPQTEG
ncbi:TrmB family transcriptional regulator [Haloarcula litorea]|uniref:TrmB family transcriptional regulator n=1 Tax=Haloarcula litorea TaxID=3032579 RepID=UPI0023E7C3C9|nr:helix-turn-helix domain-containing protein [Halomicroarcula sp. GDY20]